MTQSIPAHRDYWSTRHAAVLKNLKASVAILGLTTLWASDASAQAVQTAQTEQTAQSTNQLEEIVVTARKRQEDLQSTPVAVTAFTATALEDRSVVNVADVGKFVPNMSFQSGAAISGSSTSVTVFIRGIGQTDFTETIDPGVGIYVDGVYVSRSTGALLDTADVASIEVLRGPQGTLFGKNTIGGAVVVTTKQPTDEFEGSAQLTTGAYDRFDTTEMINIPITDKLKIRATGSLLSRDGYVKRLTDDNYMGGQDELSGRIIALLNLTDDITLTASFDANRNHEGDLGTTLIAESTAPGTFPAFYNAVTSGADCSVPTSNSKCYSSNYLTHNPYTTYNGGHNRSTLQLMGGSFTADWKINEDLDFKSITSYRRFGGSFDLDASNSPFPIDNTQDAYSDREFSQELQLSGTGFDNRLKWIVGGFFLKEQGADRNNLTFAIADFLSGGFVDNDSYAGYTQATFDVTDKFSVTYGGRYTFEDKRFTPDQYIKQDNTGGSLLALSQLFIPASINPNGNLILPRQQRTTMANEYTPAITLDYKVTPDVLAYVSFSKGFKSGGFTQRVFPPEPVTPSFGPEYVDAYEIGAKSEFFEKKLRLNVAAYYNDYTAIQEIVHDPDNVAPIVKNAGKADIAGFEVETEIVATNWLRINGGLGYTFADYRQVTAGAEESGVFLGNKLPYAPMWTGTVGANALVWEGEFGTLNFRPDVSAKSSYFPDAVNTPILRQAGFAILNLAMTFDSADGQWSVSAGGTNVTSTKYQITSYADLASSGEAYAAYARPAEWYLRAKYHFGG